MQKKIFYLLLLLLTPSLSRAQHPGNPGFARYLMSTGQNQLGRLEWERLHFYAPGDTLILNGYRDALRVDRDFEKALKLGLEYLHTNTQIQGSSHQSIYSECVRDAMWAKKYSTALELIDSLLLMPSTHHEERNQAWKVGINSLIQQNDIPQTYSVSKAVWLSALIPGSGKVYSGAWKDGLSSLLFVAANAWSSYRGFSSDKPVYGFAFATLGTAFYIGNIYGTRQWVRHVNRLKTQKWENEMLDHLTSMP